MGDAKKEPKPAVELTPISPKIDTPAVTPQNNSFTFAENAAREIGEMSSYSTRTALMWEKALKWADLNNLPYEKQKQLDKFLEETTAERRVAVAKQRQIFLATCSFAGVTLACAIQEKSHFNNNAHIFLDIAIVLAIVLVATSVYDFYKRDGKNDIKKKLQSLEVYSSSDKSTADKNIVVAQRIGALADSPKVQANYSRLFRTTKRDAIKANPDPVLKAIEISQLEVTQKKQNKEFCVMTAGFLAGVYSFTAIPSSHLLLGNSLFGAAFLAVYGAYKYIENEEEKIAEGVEARLDKVLQIPTPTTNSSSNV